MGLFGTNDQDDLQATPFDSGRQTRLLTDIPVNLGKLFQPEKRKNKKKRGRPSLAAGDPTARLTLLLPESEMERFKTFSRKVGVTHAALLRATVQAYLDIDAGSDAFADNDGLTVVVETFIRNLRTVALRSAPPPARETDPDDEAIASIYDHLNDSVSLAALNYTAHREDPAVDPLQVQGAPPFVLTDMG